MNISNSPHYGCKIIVSSNETETVIAEFWAETQAECDAWVEKNYDSNDYTWSYA